MADIRLKKASFQAENGETYELACTFNTLADLEAEYGSVYAAMTSQSIYKTVRVALASMINDYNEDHGIPERLTPTAAGRLMSPVASKCNETCKMIVDLIRASVMPAEGEQETDSKN